MIRPPTMPGAPFVVVVGAGAIGSHLIGILARDSSLAGITVIDNDVYEAQNSRSQDIHPSDLGKPKALVQSQRIREIRPDLHAEPIVDDVAAVPLGRLRSDIIFGCLDSRLYLNQAAFRLGVPWIDAGVKGDDKLARVHVYQSEPDAPCYECQFGQREYDLLEQAYECGAESPVAPTNAPAALGALAASLQAIEFQKLWEQGSGYTSFGRQVLIDAQTHQHRVSTFRRNPDCRFDHRTWEVQPIEGGVAELTLGQAFELGRGSWPSDAPLSLGIEGKHFTRRLSCTGCSIEFDTLVTEQSASKDRCARCGGEMTVAGFGRRDRIDWAAISKQDLARSLRTIGFQPGDVFSVISPTAQHHFELMRNEEIH